MEWALLPDASAADRPVLELLEEPPQDTRQQPLKAENYRTGFEPYQRVGSVFDPQIDDDPRLALLRQRGPDRRIDFRRHTDASAQQGRKQRE